MSRARLIEIIRKIKTAIENEEYEDIEAWEFIEYEVLPYLDYLAVFALNNNSRKGKKELKECLDACADAILKYYELKEEYKKPEYEEKQ